jgi:hypothetical protein
MPFGSTNALVIFQYLMNDVFHEYLEDFVVFYINDILIFSKNMEKYEHHVHLVLENFLKIELYAKLEECEFHQSKCNFWVTTSLEMAFAWIFTRFKPFLTELLQLLFKMSNVFLDLPTFINFSLPIFSNNGPFYSFDSKG